jgi:hypothetical protein
MKKFKINYSQRTKQNGGFNPCERQDNFIMEKIRKKLVTLEVPGESIPYIQNVNKTFYECYDILLEFYADEGFYLQQMEGGIKPKYFSSKLTKKQHINYLALITLSFLIEFHMFILLYKGAKYDHDLYPYKSTIKYNTASNLYNNELSNVWEIYSSNIHVPSDDYKVYQDDLPYDNINNTGIVDTLDKFCGELNSTFRNFFMDLTYAITDNINNIEHSSSVTRKIKHSEVMDNMCRSRNYEHIYENWREKILKFTNENIKNPLETKDKFYNLIYGEIIKAIDSTLKIYATHSNNFMYSTDCCGMFTWRYLYISLWHNIERETKMGNFDMVKTLRELQTKYSRARRIGNCITSTMLEHYFLNLLHFKNNSINLYLQSETGLIDGDNFYGAMHLYWNLTNENLKSFFSLKQNMKNFKDSEFSGVSHWCTALINDLNKFDNVDIKMNNLYIRDGPLDKFKTYNPISMAENKWLYLKSFITMSFDITQNFINKNISHDTSSTTQNFFRVQESIYLTNGVYQAYSHIENIIKKYNIMTDTIPLSIIPQRKISKYTDDIGKLVDMIFGIGCNPWVLPNSSNLKDYFGPNVYNKIDYNLTSPINTNKEIFKNIFTNFVTKKFYNSKETIYNFYNLMNKIFTAGIKEYTIKKRIPQDSIQFIFKGGNILKLVAATNLDSLPGTSKKPLIYTYNRYFKKSDADFQINIKDLTKYSPDPKTHAEMQQIEQEIASLTYLLLNRVRNYLLLELYKFNDYYKLSQEQKNEILSNILTLIKKLNKDKLQAPFNNPALIFNSVIYDDVFVENNSNVILSKNMPEENLREIYGLDKNSRHDFIINKTSNPDKGEIIIIPKIHTYKTSDIIISLSDIDDNSNIYKDRDSTCYYITINNIIPDFTLVRLKVCVIMKYILNEISYKTLFPGEYVDVSIPRYTKTEKYFKKNYINKYISEPDIENIQTNLEFFTLSNDALIDDLEVVIFHTNPFPWNVPKYETRMNRLILFYIFDIYKNNMSNKERIDVVNYFIDTFGEIKSYLSYKLTPDSINNIYTIIINNLSTLTERSVSKTTVDKLRIINMLNKYIVGNYFTETDPALKKGILYHLLISTDNNSREKFDKFNLIIINLLKIAIKSFTKDKNYKDNNQSIIYKQKTVPLNIYMKKYLKYKEKYTNMKNNNSNTNTNRNNSNNNNNYYSHDNLESQNQDENENESLYNMENESLYDIDNDSVL